MRLIIQKFLKCPQRSIKEPSKALQSIQMLWLEVRLQWHVFGGRSWVFRFKPWLHFWFWYPANVNRWSNRQWLKCSASPCPWDILALVAGLWLPPGQPQQLLDIWEVGWVDGRSLPELHCFPEASQPVLPVQLLLAKLLPVNQILIFPQQKQYWTQISIVLWTYF